MLLVDTLRTNEKWKNLVGKHYKQYLEKEQLFDYISKVNANDIEAVIHMGACSSTTEKDASYLVKNNYQFSQLLAQWCIENNIRFIYASSAATYGNGENGFNDDENEISLLRPLNMYGYSKQMMDEWILDNQYQKHVVGLKFFNVFGPNEYHKEDMSSVVFKSYNQILREGKICLFKSCNPDYEDGEQKRDFVYVKDCAKAIVALIKNKHVNGIFNMGTGFAHSWNDLANAIFKAMNLIPIIEYIDMPEHLKGKYQYFTEANMDKLKKEMQEYETGTLESTVRDYIQNHLMKENPYW